MTHTLLWTKLVEQSALDDTQSSHTDKSDGAELTGSTCTATATTAGYTRQREKANNDSNCMSGLEAIDMQCMRAIGSLDSSAIVPHNAAAKAQRNTAAIQASMLRGVNAVSSLTSTKNSSVSTSKAQPDSTPAQTTIRCTKVYSHVHMKGPRNYLFSASAGYLSFHPIVSRQFSCCDFSVREKDWHGKPCLSAHAQHTEPYGENLGTWRH
jgi:hypothetical protein